MTAPRSPSTPRGSAEALTRPIVVTGATGQLGTELIRLLAGRGQPVVGLTSTDVDVSQRDQVVSALVGLAPEIVIHAAAWTAVDECEGDPLRAYAVNALGTRNVAEAARRIGAHVCYLSTDYVFDGTAADPYTEWDQPNPVSAYGRSKLAGERELDPSATIVRTSWVFGLHGPNMVRTVLRLGAERRQLRFVDDQRGCPTGADDLASKVIELALERRPGVHHVTNQGPTTWFELARDVLRAAGMEPDLVEPISTEELNPPRPARRPANSVLDNAALRLSGGLLLADWHEPMERLVKELTA